MNIYTSRVRAALTGAVDARQLAADWAALYPQTVAKATGDPRVVQFLQRAWQAILGALRAVVNAMTAEGWVLGERAAEAVLEAVEAGGPPVPDWRGWTPGDAQAAAAVAGAGLRDLLAAAEIRIRSIADSRIEELADVLEETLASDVTADTGEGPEPPPRLSVGDLARQLEQVLDNPERAQLVAWTEIARAQGEGARAAYAEAGHALVDWITAMDARVCPACDAAQASNPHPLGVPPIVPMHPRCRCAEIPALEGA